MKAISRIIIILDKLITGSVVLILAVSMLFAIYAIYDVYVVYDKAELPEEILEYRPSNEEKLSIKELKDINPDICGWIRIDGTNMDYPIVIGKDNSEYINTDYKKEYALTGSIFLDYRNNRLFEDDYSIIYGHNLKADLMFAGIHNFNDKQFFDAHNGGLLYTENEIYKIEIFSYAVVSAYEKNVYGLSSNKNNSNEKILDYFNNNSINKREMDIDSTNKYLMLSTCNTAGGDDRAVLFTKITPIEESEIINKDSSISLNKIDSQLENDNKKEQNLIDDHDANKKKTIDIKSYLNIKSFIIVEVLFVIILVISLRLRKRLKRNKKEGSKTENGEE